MARCSTRAASWGLNFNKWQHLGKEYKNICKIQAAFCLYTTFRTVPRIGETCDLYLTCSFPVRKCIILYLINNYPMVVSTKWTFCLLSLVLVKLGWDGETWGRYIQMHTQSIQLILPPVMGKYELTLARQVRLDCPLLISDGTGAMSPAMCYLIQSRWSVRVRSVFCWAKCVLFAKYALRLGFCKNIFAC
jgi:hypothetical protein